MKKLIAASTALHKRKSADRGDTLVEVLVATVILGILGAALIGTLLTARPLSDRMNSNGAALAKLNAVAGRIMQQPYALCTDVTPAPYAWDQTTGVTVVVEDYKNFDSANKVDVWQPCSAVQSLTGIQVTSATSTAVTYSFSGSSSLATSLIAAQASTPSIISITGIATMTNATDANVDPIAVLDLASVSTTAASATSFSVSGTSVNGTLPTVLTGQLAPYGVAALAAYANVQKITLTVKSGTQTLTRVITKAL